MGAATTTPVQQPTLPPRPHRRSRVVVSALVLGILAAAALVLTVFHGVGREDPTFPSLADNPDPALHGTVAYLGRDRCIQLVAAAGRPTKQLLCLPQQDVNKAKALGKEQGPQLRWRPDGRLEVTMFRMTDPPGPGFNPGWQKLVDVRTGAVEDVPAAAVPTQPDRSTQPAANAAGQRISWTSDERSGRIKVVLYDGTAKRTLLSARGGGEYTYRLSAAFWSPDGRWIAADDGRILVITPTDPPVTRVLTDQVADVGFGGDGLARFAVTGADLLPAG